MAVRIPRRLGCRDVLASEDSLGGCECVDTVGLSSSPVASAGALHLEDQVSRVLKVLAQAGAPAAGALDPEHELSRVGELLSPGLQLRIAGSGRREHELGEHLPDMVERDRVVALLVGVDPDCDHPSSSSSSCFG
jgi:hypothetical protein